MAITERLALLITANPDQAISGLKNLERQADKSLGKTEDKSKRMAAGFQKAGVGMIASGGLIAAGLLHAAKASEEANLSTVKLQNTLDNMPKLAGQNARQFTDLATAIQKKTAADGDAIIAGEAMLGTFNLTATQIKGITPLVVDYARKFGTDIPSAAITVGKALDGQIGALKRNGVSIDAVLFKTDRYKAVQKALADQVGGFAEKEGKTFSGRLESLKNQLGDVEEGVGSGAVIAFEKLLGPVSALSTKFTELSPATQTVIGEIGAYGAGALLAVGGTSALIGQVLQMKENFSVLGDKVGDVTEKFTLLRGIIPALEFAGGAIAVTALVDQLANLETELLHGHANLSNIGLDLVKFANNGKVGSELTKQFGDNFEQFGKKIDNAGKSAGSFPLVDAILGEDAGEIRDAAHDVDALDKQLAKLVQSGHADVAKAAFERLSAILVAQGGKVSTLKGRFNDYANAVTDAKTQTLLQSRGIKDNTDKLGGNTDALGQNTAATVTQKDVTDYLTASFKANIAALDERYAALHKGLDANLDYEDAIDKLETTLKSNTGTLDIHTQAGRDNVRAVEDAQNAIYQLTKDTYENTGSVDAASGAAALYTQNLANQLTQAGFTKVQVKQLIDQIALTPAQVSTIFSTPGLPDALLAATSYASALDRIGSHSDVLFQGTGGGSVRFHAAGGMLDKGWNVVGEQGPELAYNAGGSVRVFSNANSRAMASQTLASKPQVIWHNEQHFHGTTDAAEAGMAAMRELKRMSFLLSAS